jgi:hypothetical protein
LRGVKACDARCSCGKLMATADYFAHELRQRIAKRRQELLEQMANGLPPEDYQRAIGRVLELSEVLNILQDIKRKIDE